jgi:hypothetical protein
MKIDETFNAMNIDFFGSKAEMPEAANSVNSF